jgi:hypothetical protein
MKTAAPPFAKSKRPKPDELHRAALKKLFFFSRMQSHCQTAPGLITLSA